MSRAQIVEIMGVPHHVRTGENREILSYGDEGGVFMQDGRLSHFYVKSERILTYTVDAIKSGDQLGRKAFVASGMKGVTNDDLQFREYSTYLKSVLQKRGFQITETAGDADLAINLTYSISDPQVDTENYAVPVYGQVSSGKTTTYSSSGGGFLDNVVASSGPEYGVVGMQNRQVKTTTFIRTLVMEAVDFRHYQKTKQVRQSWKVTLTSTGESGDLREVFPMMVAASTDYIDSNTRKKLEWYLSESDPRLAVAIRGEDKARMPASAR